MNRRLDWEGLLAPHDLLWDTPPRRWLDGLFLANGQLGAMIWGDGAPLRLTLDKHDAWELRERAPDPRRFTYDRLRALVEAGEEAQVQRMLGARSHGPRSRPYPTRLPLPRLELDFGAPAERFDARLELFEARASGRLGLPAGEVEWTAWAQADWPLLTVSFEGELLPRAELSLQALYERGPAGQAPAWQTLQRWGYEPPEWGELEGGQWLRLRFPAGGEYVVAFRLQPRYEGADLHLTLLTHRDADDPLTSARLVLQEALARGWEELAEGHRRWWARWWPAGYLSLPDSRLENLYYAEMYKLGSNARPQTYPVTLQGLWTSDGVMPPWSGDLHLDMNVQETYWPVYASNRLGVAESLYETLFACLPRFEQNCRQFFGFEGLWSGCAVAPTGQRVWGYPAVELWPGNLAWVAHLYWLHWLYSQDADFLRERALPLMTGCLRTYLGLLEEDEQGRLHLPLSNSPEWGEGGLAGFVRDPSGDLALIRWLAQSLLEAGETLGTPSPLAAECERALERLADYPRGPEGLWIAEGVPLGHSHRHHTHLLALHPLGLLDPAREPDGELIRRSLDHLRRLGTGQWTGWAFPWASLLASRAGEGAMAWQMLDLYARAFVAPNSLHTNGDPRRLGVSAFTYEPMTLEAGFAAAAAVMEMLLQSQGGLIRLFPAVPDHWPQAYFQDLRAEGAFLLTSRLREREALYAEITSEAGGPCRVLSPWEGPVMLRDGEQPPQPLPGPSRSRATERRILAFDTEPGGRYLLYPHARPPRPEDLVPVVPQRPVAESHWYGLRRLPRF